MSAPEISGGVSSQAGLASIRRPMFVDGKIVVVPVRHQIERVINDWSREHHEDLDERLKPFGISSSEIGGSYSRLVRECDVPLVRNNQSALAFVDKALDNVADGEYVWSNAEVVAMLEDVRSILVTGHVTPGEFTNHTNRRENGR